MTQLSNDHSSAQELYFLYELAKVFSSSLDLSEVAEYVMDGACALIGAEQGFLCALEAQAKVTGDPIAATDGNDEADLDILRPYVLRGISRPVLQALTPQLQPVWLERQGLNLRRSESEPGLWKDLLAAPLVVRDQVHGVLCVLTATARQFTPRELERMVSVANLGALALENARLHDQIQREVQMLRRLIQAARQMGDGQLSAEQIVELEASVGLDEIGRLSQAFAQMARQVIEREESLHRKVRELEIVIDEARRDKQITEITETDYFRRLQQKIEELRARRDNK